MKSIDVMSEKRISSLEKRATKNSSTIKTIETFKENLQDSLVDRFTQIPNYKVWYEENRTSTCHRIEEAFRNYLKPALIELKRQQAIQNEQSKQYRNELLQRIRSLRTNIKQIIRNKSNRKQNRKIFDQ